MTRSLKEKAIKIKGKAYVLVKDRVIYFNENYPNGSIQTQREKEGEVEIIKAFVVPDVDKPQRMFTGYSQATRGDGLVNQTAALENAETSAVGRALAMMGIGVIDSIASADEIRKAQISKSENPNGRFKKAIENTEFMKQCLDQDDFINKIKSKYTVDEIQEHQLRSEYEKLHSAERAQLTEEGPF